MKKEIKPKHFVKKPQYPGGRAAMKAFIKKELRYPKEALKQKIEGVVRVRYMIDKNGNVVKTKILVHLGHGCDEEAERVVSLFKFHVPKNHMKVHFHKNINIQFKLPKQKKVKYVYENKSKDESTASVYNYTISF